VRDPAGYRRRQLANQRGDPICFYDGNQNDLEKNVKVHEIAYTEGSPSVADDGGNWLATRIGGSAG
jgi:hypothetical protein